MSIIHLEDQVINILHTMKSITPGYDHKQYVRIQTLFDELLCSIRDIKTSSSFHWSIVSLKKQIFYLYSTICLDSKYGFQSLLQVQTNNLFKSFMNQHDSYQIQLSSPQSPHA